MNPTRSSRRCRRRSTSPRRAASTSRSCISNARAPNNWGKAAAALDMIARAKARGLDVDCDAYPYAAGSNPLKNLLPQWVQAGGVPAMLERLKLRETRDNIRADIERDGLNNWGRIPSWDCVQISISPHLPQFAGRTILSLATERGQDPIDTLCDYPHRRPGRDPGAGHLDLRGRHRAYRRFADGPGRLRRQLRRALWPGRQGHAAPALLRHLPAHHPPLRARARRAAAGVSHPQDDRRDRARAQALGPRAVEARLSRRRRDLRSGGFPRPRHLCRSAPVSERRANAP